MKPDEAIAAVQAAIDTDRVERAKLIGRMMLTAADADHLVAALTVYELEMNPKGAEKDHHDLVEAKLDRFVEWLESGR